MANTRLWYSYKSHNGNNQTKEIVLAGEVTADDLKRMERALVKGSHFIPSQVGLPSLNSGSEDDAQVWHKIDLSEASQTLQKPTFKDFDIHALADNFSQVVWNPGMETARLYGAEGKTLNLNPRIMRQH